MAASSSIERLMPMRVLGARRFGRRSLAGLDGADRADGSDLRRRLENDGLERIAAAIRRAPCSTR